MLRNSAVCFNIVCLDVNITRQNACHALQWRSRCRVITASLGANRHRAVSFARVITHMLPCRRNEIGCDRDVSKVVASGDPINPNFTMPTSSFRAEILYGFFFTMHCRRRCCSGSRKPFFEGGVNVKNKVLWYMIRIDVLQLDRWSLRLL